MTDENEMQFSFTKESFRDWLCNTLGSWVTKKKMCREEWIEKIWNELIEDEKDD